MENASKALIMAGGLLISILVASFMIFVLRKAGSMSAEYDVQMSDNELAKFNSQFEAYVRDDNTFFDVITVVNLAYDINKKNGWDEQNGVTIKLYDGNSVKYSILPKEGLEKNYFFKGETGTDGTVYIYNELQSDLTDGSGAPKSIIDYYTEMEKDSSTNTQKYKYKFKGEIKEYNSITGKVSEMNFRKENN